MKKIFTILALSCITSIAFAQIPVTTIKVLTEEELKQMPFDDSKNFLGEDVYGYMNEELFLPHRAEGDRELGWSKFVKEPIENLYNPENVYHVDAEQKTKYDAVANKIFKVIDVFAPSKDHWGSSRIHFLKLEDTKTKDTVLFVYDNSDAEYFPFIAMKYYERLKKEQIGQSFVFQNKYIKAKKDVETGRPISLTKDESWKCTNITLNGQDYQLSMLLKNNRGNTILSSIKYALTENRAYKQKDIDQFHQRFGANWDKILNSDIEVGFTPEMVRLSWGEPKRVTRSSEGESWHYGHTILQFKNGKLESFY